MAAAFATRPATVSSCQLFVDVETHVGQLQTDVGIEMVGSDGIENLVIEFGAVARLLGIGNVFPQVVDADAHARAIDDLGDAHGVGNPGTGNETAGDALSDRRALGEVAQRTVLGKMDEKGP